MFGRQDGHIAGAATAAFYFDKSRQDSALDGFTSHGSPGFINCESTGKFDQYNS